jgi:hypothetical protein
MNCPHLAKPFRDLGKARCGSVCHGVALLRGFVTPSLTAQGRQRLPSYFNIQRGNPIIQMYGMKSVSGTHSLRASGAVLTYALRDHIPFDIAGQRVQRYTLLNGELDPTKLDIERKELTEMITATLGDWRVRRSSPVYQAA